MDSRKRAPDGMLRSRLVAGALAAIGLFVASVLVPEQTVTVHGAALQPAAIPMLAALGIIFCGVALLVRPTPDGGAGPVVRPLASILLLVVGTYFAAEHLGYVVAAPGAVLAMMLVMGERRPLLLLVGTAVAPAIIWLIFGFVLGRPLP